MSSSYHPCSNRKNTASYFSLERQCSLVDKRSEPTPKNLTAFLTLLLDAAFFFLFLSFSSSLLLLFLSPSSTPSLSIFFSLSLSLSPSLPPKMKYLLYYIRTYNTKWWQGRRQTGPFICCWWKYKTARSLWGKVWQFLIKSKHASNVWPSHSVPRCIPKGNENMCPQKDLYKMPEQLYP